MATVWILNLDAEFEMAQPQAYAPSAAELRGLELGMQKAVRCFPASTRFASLDEVRAGLHKGAQVRAWCPTPRVHEACERGGVELEDACEYEVIRAVNDRAFRSSLPDEFPGGGFFERGSTAVEDVQGKLRSEARNWLLKRAFGVAGRGQRRVRWSDMQAADAAWIEASFRTGGLQVEPLVSITAEFSLHGRIERDGQIHFGMPCVAENDGTGHFSSAHVAVAAELLPNERNQLIASGRRVAEALIERGYFGPFGIDAFRWLDEDGLPQFRSLSEINARYTLGWAVGMQDNGG